MTKSPNIPTDLKPMVDDLRRFITKDIHHSFGTEKIKLLHPFINPIILKPALGFSKVGALLDTWVKESGAAAALKKAVPIFLDDLSANLLAPVPKNGPVLIVSNHPGSVDSLSIASLIGREDLKIVARAFPFLQRLPHVSRHLIFVPPESDAFGRMRVVREIIRHLKSGGAVLLFPTGHIDPDPAFFPNPLEHIQRWSRSLEIIIRTVPDVQLVPAVASSFLNLKFLRHPIIFFAKYRNDKQRIAEFLHIMNIMVTGKNLITGKISIGRSFQLNHLEIKSKEWFDHVLERSKTLLQHHTDTFPPEVQLDWQERPYQA